MEKLNQLERDVSNLKIHQATTSQKVEHLEKEIVDHVIECKDLVKKDDLRHFEQQSLLTKLTENVESISTSTLEFKKDIKSVQEVSTKTAASVETHSWLLKSIVGVVIIAALGSFVNGVISYQVSSTQQQLQQTNDKVDIHPRKNVEVPPRRQSMNSTEANRNKWAD